MNMKRTLLGEVMPKRTESVLCAIIALAVTGLVNADNWPGDMRLESDWTANTTLTNVSSGVDLSTVIYWEHTPQPKPAKITDEQALLQLLGHDEIFTPIPILKAYLFNREAAQIINCGENVDKLLDKMTVVVAEKLIEAEAQNLSNIAKPLFRKGNL